jgi:hypothetical protein
LFFKITKNVKLIVAELVEGGGGVAVTNSHNALGYCKL